MGRPSKPVELKRRTGRSSTVASDGTKLPEPVVVLVASNKAPPAPASLCDDGRAAWTSLWEAGRAWLSIQNDVIVLTMLCEAIDERAALRDQIIQDGYMVDGSVGQKRRNPLIADVRALEAQITRWLAECGFTPSARARLGYAEVKRVSKLDEMMARRSKRGTA